MVNPSKRKGTEFESRVVEYLRQSGFPYAERRAQRGSKDCGDIAGVVGWTLECKAERQISLASYVDEARAEACNADPAIVNLGGLPPHAAIVKRRNKSVDQAYVIMSLEVWCNVTRDYPDPLRDKGAGP